MYHEEMYLQMHIYQALTGSCIEDTILDGVDRVHVHPRRIDAHVVAVLVVVGASEIESRRRGQPAACR